MKLRLVASLMLLTFVSVGGLFLGTMNAQNKNSNDNKPATVHTAPKIKTTSTKAQQASAGTPDTNVKTDTAPNSKDGQKGPTLPKKGGPQGKGYGSGYVEVTFDNYTNLYIKCFVDGAYRGTVAPRGELTFATGNGATSLYARADFTDGSYSYWGPSETYYYSGYRYTWRLNP